MKKSKIAAALAGIVAVGALASAPSFANEHANKDGKGKKVHKEAKAGAEKNKNHDANGCGEKSCGAKKDGESHDE